jgi:hypothetical protein
MLNAIEHTNFFENRATEYSKASTTGSWEEAWSCSIGDHWRTGEGERVSGDAVK